MKVKLKEYSARGDDVLLEYDPATANMKEVKEYIDTLERKTGGRVFADTTAEVVTKVTPETGDMTLVRPIAGG